MTSKKKDEPTATSTAEDAPLAVNVHQAIMQVYQQVGYVAKKGTVHISGSRGYTFAGEAEFIAAIRPAMIQAGLYQVPFQTDVITNERIESERVYNGVVQKSYQHRVVVHVIYRLWHAPSGTYLDVEAFGEGMDSGDKAFNKAMTIANKYALRQTFMIETGDDPDKYASTESGGVADVSAPAEPEPVRGWQKKPPQRPRALSPDASIFPSAQMRLAWRMGVEAAIKSAADGEALRVISDTHRMRMEDLRASANAEDVATAKALTDIFADKLTQLRDQALNT